MAFYRRVLVGSEVDLSKKNLGKIKLSAYSAAGTRSSNTYLFH